jgi:primosomal protein N' (replication factor Y)
VSVARHGVGTERLEHELHRTLATPDFPVLRLDADTVGVDARARVLERFQAAPSGVLIGTQMIAKGHDFADVGLGVVIDADQTLRFPDFRAEERTFALLTQLAGRTGRGQAGGERGGGPDRGSAVAATGRVLVQTSAPQARAIVLASRHDSDTFVRGELRRRKALSYPPFATLIRVVCSATDPECAFAATTELKDRTDAPGAAVLGPAPLFTLRGRARSQLVIKASDRAVAIAAVGEAVDALSGERRHREVAFAVDVDPQ